MPGYLIALIEVTDPERYREYVKHSPRAIGRFGGRFLVRGGAITALEGPAPERRIVVIEFPSREDALAFYGSDEYRKVRRLREGAGRGQFFVVDGYPGGDWQAALAASNALSLPD